jgi:hypothetical protein
VIGEGMPLVYNGQEAGNFKRLEFFELDPIEWRSHPNGELYKSLFALKKANTALWNARWGARMVNVPNSAPLEVFSFVRQNERDKVFAVLNFSAQRQRVAFQERLFCGKYLDYFGERPVELGDSFRLTLEPWDYRVFV